MPTESMPNLELPTLSTNPDDPFYLFPPLQIHSEPEIVDEIPTESRANPRNFGGIITPGDESAVYIAQPTSDAASEHLQARPFVPPGLHRSNAFRVSPSTSSSPSPPPGLPRRNAIRVSPLPPSTPSTPPAPRKARRDGRVLERIDLDGVVIHDRFRPVPLDYGKKAPAKTPTIVSGHSERDNVSPLLPRSGLARDWEEMRKNRDEERNMTWDEVISNRARVQKWREGIEDPLPIMRGNIVASEYDDTLSARIGSTRTPGPAAPAFNAARLTRRVFGAPQEQAPPAFDAARLTRKVFGQPTAPAGPPPFDAARLTRKVFGIYKDEKASPAADSTRSRRQDTPRPSILQDTTNIAGGHPSAKQSEEQLLQDAFAHPPNPLDRPGGRQGLRCTLPRPDTDIPALVQANDDALVEQLFHSAPGPSPGSPLHRSVLEHLHQREREHQPIGPTQVNSQQESTQQQEAERGFKRKPSSSAGSFESRLWARIKRGGRKKAKAIEEGDQGSRQQSALLPSTRQPTPNTGPALSPLGQELRGADALGGNQGSVRQNPQTYRATPAGSIAHRLEEMIDEEESVWKQS